MALVDDARVSALQNQSQLYNKEYNKIVSSIIDAASAGHLKVACRTEHLPQVVTDDLIAAFQSEGFQVRTIRRYGEITERILIDWTP